MSTLSFPKAEPNSKEPSVFVVFAFGKFWLDLCFGIYLKKFHFYYVDFFRFVLYTLISHGWQDNEYRFYDNENFVLKKLSSVLFVFALKQILNAFR